MSDYLDCPHCGKQLRLPAALTGKRVRCHCCQSVFVVPSLRFATEEPEEKDSARRRPNRSFRDEEDEDEDFEERECRPRKRGGRLTRAEVRQMVQGPGLALMFIGILSALQSILIIAVAVTAFRRAAVVGFAIGLAATICLFFGAATIRGGFNMTRLIGHRTAMECSVFAMLPFCCCGMLGLPVGIWSLTVLRQRGVREVFVRDPGRPDGY